jgi:diguanylate cyclase (GGDEF)-like protein
MQDSRPRGAAILSRLMLRTGAISISAKLSLGFGIALALIVAAGAIGGSQIWGFDRFTRSITTDWVPEIEALGAVKRAMVEHRLFAARVMETASWLQRAEAQSELYLAESTRRAAQADYERFAERPAEKSRISQYASDWRDYQRAFDEASRQRDQGEIAAARETMATKALPAFASAMASLDGLLALSKQERLASVDEANRIFTVSLFLIVGMILVGAIGVGCAVIWINRNISRPILRVSDAMRRLAAGDDSGAIAQGPPRRDEIGTLIEAVSGYRTSLQQSRALSEQATLTRERLEAAARNIAVGVSMFDAERRLVFCNQAYADIYHLPTELIKLGTPWHEIVLYRIENGIYAGQGPETYRVHLSETVERAERYTELVELRDGRLISLVHQPIAEGGWVTTHDDVTNLKRNEARIVHMAHHDPLTDLPNRLLFNRRLTELLAERSESGGVAVLCLDVDYFKSVNDTLGHPIGDIVLREVAARLEGSLFDQDMVARFGGDEFVVVQSGIAQPAGSAELAQRIVDTVSAPYSVEGHEVVIGMSVGIAIGPSHGTSADQLIKNGDIALYRAKADGRGMYRFFEPEMDASAQARRGLELDLRRALPNNEFELAYQPIIELATGRITSFEALLRWRHPQRGLVLPGAFIPLAEEIGLIVPIGEWVVRQACLAATAWPDAVKVAVNLSAVQFRGNRLLSLVVAALAASGLPASRLELEITETVLLGNTEATLAILQQLRTLGVRIAMDDFGTGYSSLSYLRRFPFDKIKIDQSFIRDSSETGNSRAIVRAAAGLGTSFGIATTAEGVETQWQLERIKADGCTEAQGYLFSPPVPAGDIAALFRSWNRVRAILAA